MALHIVSLQKIGWDMWERVFPKKISRTEKLYAIAKVVATFSQFLVSLVLVYDRVKSMLVDVQTRSDVNELKHEIAILKDQQQQQIRLLKAVLVAMHTLLPAKEKIY